MFKRLKQNEIYLKNSGRWGKQPTPQSTVLFQLPLKKKNGISDGGFFAISGFFDHNPVRPGALLDYNCGDRSSDNAINHRGTDYYLFPYAWKKMRDNDVEAVAAAAGMIIGKFDGHFDECGCVWTDCNNWNAVYIKHADNTIAFYGHLKKNSLLPKGIGDTVSAGEYLGVVGSSGQSSGPHLHFEVWQNESYTQLIDPYAGPCNYINGNSSKWIQQEPYRASTLSAVRTHSDYPQMGSCPATEVMNEKNEFANGNKVVMGSYFRDQIAGQVVIHSVIKPDGTLLGSWQQTFTDTYTAAYWLADVYLPNPAPTGIWHYKATYNGQSDSAAFAVNILFQYRFTGNGNYSAASNWQNNKVPPNPVPRGIEVVIDNQQNECIIDVPVTFQKGAKLTISQSNKIKIPQNLLIN
ncbi:MAG TPA: M23 family metallopeptidase [Ferruginibacter sp.]|nr:M23 family metallopeptidase [Ferruginibacter sp.]